MTQGPEEKIDQATVRDEARLVRAVTAWLEADGWTVRMEVKYCDIVATRNGHRLHVEVKKGDRRRAVDVLYGQILRRMTAGNSEAEGYAIVVPEANLWRVREVPDWVRQALHIRVFAVSSDDRVREIETA
jgi:hypothetical protein